MGEQHDKPIRRTVPPDRIPKPRPPTPPFDGQSPHGVQRRPGASRITVEDVRAYVLTHPCAGGKLVDGVDAPTIVDIREMTDKECSALTHTWITGVDDRPVVYVKLRGPFILTGMSYPPGAGITRTPTVECVEEVFDAISGGLVMWG